MKPNSSYIQNKIAVFGIIFAFLCWPGPTHAEDGVSHDRILFGQSAAIEGPAAKLGQGMRDGILAAFAEANAAGGVNGQQLDLVTLDDGYEPDRAIKNAQILLQQKKVFALIGGVGTPTSKAIEPITSAAKVPYIGPFTGVEYLRTPFKRYVVNVRGSYYEETETMAAYLVDKKKYTKIAILYQDDSFGRAGLEGLVRALSRRQLAPIAEATFKRNTTAVKHAALDISKAHPQAIVVIGPYEPMATFVSLYKKDLNQDLEFMTVSFVGTDALASALGPMGKDVLVTEVTPYPHDNNIAIVSAYQKAMKAHKPDAGLDYVSLEGYITGRFAIEVLKNSGQPITREKFIDSIYQKETFDMDGIHMKFGENDNQGLSDIFMTRLTGDGMFVPF